MMGLGVGLGVGFTMMGLGFVMGESDEDSSLLLPVKQSSLVGSLLLTTQHLFPDAARTSMPLPPQ